MTDKADRPNLPAVQIAGTEVNQITYKGDAVVTFAMVDEVHQRADGTASRNFRENRERFVDGEDFVEAPHDAVWSDVSRRTKGGNRKPIILITRRGYLKLVKPMQDDRAWEVQGEMIDRYFAVENGALDAPAMTPALSREARLQFKNAHWLGKQLGLTGNQLILSANNATKRLTGVDMMGLLGATHVDAPQNEALSTPTDIGKALRMTARAVNLSLTQLGYQTAFRDAKGTLVYEPTDKGRRAGGTMQDTGKQHSTGTPVRQLKWPTSMIGRLAEDLEIEAQ